MTATYITADKSIIQKASRFFDASLISVVNELVQNARRANATQVKINLLRTDDDYIHVSISDNGPGIFKNGFNIVLSGSGWDDGIQEEEDPAGMGIFSLANLNPFIRANGLETTLTANQFNGLDPVVINKFEETVGTYIAFNFKTSETLDYLQRKVIHHVKCVPIDVYVNEELVAKESVFEDGLPIYKFADVEYQFSSSYGPFYGPVLNFKGLLVNNLPFPSLISDILRYADINLSLNAKSARGLEFKLPDRQSIVETEFWFSLCENILDTLVEQRLDNHKLPYQIYKQILDSGRTLKEKTPWYLVYSDDVTLDEVVQGMCCYDIKSELPENSVYINSCEHREGFLCELMRCFPNVSFFATKSTDDGYSWQKEQNPKQLKHLEASVDGKTFVLYDDTADFEEDLAELPERFIGCSKLIELTMVLRNGHVFKTSTDIITSKALNSGYYYVNDLDEALFIISKRCSFAEAVRVADRSIFVYDEDCTDGYETQRENHRQYAIYTLKEFIDPDLDWTCQELYEQIDYDSFVKNITKGFTGIIKISSTGGMQIALTDGRNVKTAETMSTTPCALVNFQEGWRLWFLSQTKHSVLIAACVATIAFVSGLLI